MERYLLSMPANLKQQLKEIAKKEGYSLNAQILFILSEWLKKRWPEVITKLKAALTARGITIYSLSKTTGIQYELLRRVFKGSRKLPADELVLILDKTGISIEEIKWISRVSSHPAQSVDIKLFYFLVCDNALPATFLHDLLDFLLFKIFEAIVATLLLVCFLFAIHSPPLNM